MAVFDNISSEHGKKLLWAMCKSLASVLKCVLTVLELQNYNKRMLFKICVYFLSVKFF